MEQNLLHQGKLLDENGNLTEAGYHYRLVKEPEFYSCYAIK